jgi:hypothetical protein
MSDHLTVILPPVLSDEERIEKALDYSSLTEGDGYGDGDGDGWGDGDGDGWGDGDGYGTGSGSGYGDGYSFCVGDGDGDGGSNTDV